MFIDITRAHPHYSTRRQVCFQHPAEDPRSGEADVCGLLQRSFLGLRDTEWYLEQRTRIVMDKIGFTCGLWFPCVFTYRGQNMPAYVYEDNFVIKGVRRELNEYSTELKTHMLAKNEGVREPDYSQRRVFRNCPLEPCLSMVCPWWKPT